jgi:hypothetical protein
MRGGAPGRPAVPEETPATTESYDISPVGAALTFAGGVALAVSTLLPLDEPSGTFATVQSNTLIQHGGWFLIAPGGAGAIAAYENYHNHRRSWAAIILAVIAIAEVVHLGTDKTLRTLYPIGSDGQPDTSQPGTVVPLGIGIYLAGIGGAGMLVGGWLMRRDSVPTALTTKECPDCAETVLVAANVCKHCGHQFAPGSEGTLITSAKPVELPPHLRNKQSGS